MDARMRELRKILEETPLCDECIGRLFPYVEGRNNRERGRRVRETLGLAPMRCSLCGNIFERLEEVVRKFDPNLYQFETFVLGTKVSKERLALEEKILERVGLVEGIETLKKNINRELGKLISSKYKKKFDNKSPDMEVIFDLEKEKFYYNPRPLYIYGRYRKYNPMPQTKWPCRYCGGIGCKKCNYTGRQWKESVEYYMADVLLAVTMGRATKLHAAGREDIDARMLGEGRPFVIEIVAPRRRDINLEAVREEINAHAEGKMEVVCLKWSTRQEAVELKQSNFIKTYVAHVRCRGGVGELEGLSSLKGATILQRTPTRLLHRKKDKLRRRKVIDLSWKVTGSHTLDLTIVAESGLYIKEFVSGDGGRTTPSVSEVVGRECFVEALDVVEVRGGRACKE